MTNGNLTDAEIRELVDEAAKQAARQAVRETLLTLGIDSENPLETQKDFQHLRGWRTATDTMKRQGILTATGVIVAGGLGILWYSIRGH